MLEELKLKIVLLFSPSHTPHGIRRKMDKESTVVPRLVGMLHPQKGAVKFLLENSPETFLKMSLSHCVKKWVWRWFFKVF